MMRLLPLAAALAIAGGPVSGGPSQDCAAYFDLGALNAEQRAWTESVLEAVTFPCDRFAEPLTEHPARDDIVVLVSELDGHAGQNSEGVRIDVDDDYIRTRNPERRWRKVIAHEVGHSADLLTFDDRTRQLIREDFGVSRKRFPCWLEHRCLYERRVGEAFADAFTRGFTDVDAVPPCPVPERECARDDRLFPTWEKSRRIARTVRGEAS